MRTDKIMVVDDDPAIRRLAEVSLAQLGGWQVSLAASGAQALERIFSEKPDVLLIDVMMPGMDGPTTVNLIKENGDNWNTPVIFFTAKCKNDDMKKFAKLGAGVISKPFDPMTLSTEIKNILARGYAKAAG